MHLGLIMEFIDYIFCRQCYCCYVGTTKKTYQNNVLFSGRASFLWKSVDSYAGGIKIPKYSKGWETMAKNSVKTALRRNERTAINGNKNQGPTMGARPFPRKRLLCTDWTSKKPLYTHDRGTGSETTYRAALMRVKTIKMIINGNGRRVYIIYFTFKRLYTNAYNIILLLYVCTDV